MASFIARIFNNITFGVLILLPILISCKRQNIDKNCCSSPPAVFSSETAHLGIPNIFTPDGDGANDLLFPLDSGIANFEFHVKDKFGKTMYLTTSSSFLWDGTHEGKTLNGVYDYELNAKTQDGTSIEHIGKLCIISNYEGNCIQNSSSCVFDLEWTGSSFNTLTNDLYKPCP